MADASENIEARLAAYIDGEMAEGDRRDIEQYLAANPTHAKLIAELRTQATQLNALPREKAPVEVMDHLQQHLERHALLEDGNDPGGSMRVNRWPQLTAAAAMLVLAAGLGLLVYQVLPGGGRGDHLTLGPTVMQNMSHLPTDDASTTQKSEKLADDAAANPDEAKKLEADRLPAGAMVESPLATGPQALSEQASQMPTASAFNKQSSAIRQNMQQNYDLNAQAATPREAHKAAAENALKSTDDLKAGRPRDYVEEAAASMLKDQESRRVATGPAPHATLSVLSDDPAMSGALVAAYLVQHGITFDVPPSPPKAQANAPSTQPSPAPLVLHNISPERARGLRIALAEQRPGRQVVTLQPALSLTPPVTTQPAKNEDQALAMMERAQSMPSPPASRADTSPAPQTAFAGVASLSSTTQPTTQKAVAKTATIEEAGDLWIVISMPPTTAPAVSGTPTTQPATPPPMTTPAYSAPTTAPATMPAHM